MCSRGQAFRSDGTRKIVRAPHTGAQWTRRHLPDTGERPLRCDAAAGAGAAVGAAAQRGTGPARSARAAAAPFGLAEPPPRALTHGSSRRTAAASISNCLLRLRTHASDFERAALELASLHGMRIDYIAGAYIPHREANSMHVMRMCQAMAGLGHDVTLHVRRGDPGVSDDFAHYGVEPVFRIVKHTRPQIRVYGALVNAGHVARYYANQPYPDLLYAREVYGLAAVATRTDTPFIYESHWRPKHRVQRELEGWLFRRPGFRRVVFISEALRRIYASEFPNLPAAQMLVAHDAADAIRLPESGETTHPPLRVGYVGGFLPGYGLEVLIALARRHPDMEFHVVGGKEHELKKWRSEARDTTNLRFHGFVAPARLGEHYARFDVVLAPYQRGTAHIDWISPMKLFEYMAHEKAIICSDFPVLREILRHDVDALLVEPHDIDAWSRALATLRDPAVRRRLAACGRERLKSDFTWARRAQRVLADL